MHQSHVRNIGGSLLPSSSPAILQPLDCAFGRLVVRARPAKDTHVLILVADGAEKELASHPNGFSCRNLAERMACGDLARIRAQASYIVACGGTAAVEDIVQTVTRGAAAM